MPVQRHRRDAELLGELADGQRLEPVRVGQLERPFDDSGLAELSFPQPLASGRSFLLASGRYFPPLAAGRL
jgi:hypothetical protein